MKLSREMNQEITMQTRTLYNFLRQKLPKLMRLAALSPIAWMTVQSCGTGKRSHASCTFSIRLRWALPTLRNNQLLKLYYAITQNINFSKQKVAAQYLSARFIFIRHHTNKNQRANDQVSPVVRPSKFQHIND
jgi:hypothetical protein